MRWISSSCCSPSSSGSPTTSTTSSFSSSSTSSTLWMEHHTLKRSVLPHRRHLAIPCLLRASLSRPVEKIKEAILRVPSQRLIFWCLEGCRASPFLF
ncbi:MAG: hypothetical protein DRG55_02950 [Deltaproteobacteria bacterium]|nr:MAG: hypothetical protein DRG69_06715 [Deltaproteobacteria bacterium]RLB02453.1 MAG: hypothetical protein DRG55_02950 [Deltaproteobacteria bacterium]